MDRFNAIAAFAKVVETGSFARAAERLDVSVSSVSRHRGRTRGASRRAPLNRTTRRLSLTETGRAFHERCVQLLADLEEAEQSAGAAPSCRAARCAFRARSPSARTTWRRRSPRSWRAIRRCGSTSSSPTALVDLVDEGFDAAVRIGAIRGQNLVGRRVGATQLVCCASPAYLARHGEPRPPPTSRTTRACSMRTRRSATSGRSPTRTGEERSVRVAGPVHSNNGSFSAALAVEGVGIAFEPDFIVGATSAPDDSSRCCARSRRRPPASTWSTRAAGTCPRRCARSRSSCRALCTAGVGARGEAAACARMTRARQRLSQSSR